MAAWPLDIECPHLSLVGDTECRLCLQPLRGEALTDQNDGVDWPEGEAPEPVVSWEPLAEAASNTAVRYPEYPPLAEAPISINFKVTGEPQITVRGFDATQINQALSDLSAMGTWANVAAAQADLRVQGGLGAGLGPVSPVGPPEPAQAGYAPGPATPPPFGPNVSVPNAPGYQGPASYPSGPPQQPQWQGQGGGNGGGQAQPQLQPPGWMRVNARTGPGFDAWKALREQQKDYLKGKIKWGGKSDYWIEPSIAQWLAQQGFAVTQ